MAFDGPWQGSRPLLSPPREWHDAGMPGKKRRLEDAYRFPGFRPSRWVVGVFGDPQVRIMVLEREQKKPLAAFAVKNTGHFTTARDGLCGIFPAGIRACISMWSSGEWRAAVVVL